MDGDGQQRDGCSGLTGGCRDCVALYRSQVGDVRPECLVCGQLHFAYEDHGPAAGPVWPWDDGDVRIDVYSNAAPPGSAGYRYAVRVVHARSGRVVQVQGEGVVTGHAGAMSLRMATFLAKRELAEALAQL